MKLTTRVDDVKRTNVDISILHLGTEVATCYVDNNHEEYARIWAVKVYPRYQGLGIAKFLMITACRTAKEMRRRSRETHIVWLSVDKQNTIARNLYESLGFTYYGDVRSPLNMTMPLLKPNMDRLVEMEPIVLAKIKHKYAERTGNKA